MCGFILDKLPLPTAAHFGNGDLRRMEWERRKGSFAFTGMGCLTCWPHRELPWLEIFSCLRSTRVRLSECRKLKGEGGKDPSEGQGEKSLTVLGKGGPAGSPWGFGSSWKSNLSWRSSEPPGSTRVSPLRESPEKLPENPGRVLALHGSVPCEGHQMGGPNPVEASMWAVKEFT